ncbi:MAG: MOP flippase family protein [Chloroflexi bacterium]|nr:MOP flippase family protein [Chloroflexota bacterium]
MNSASNGLAGAAARGVVWTATSFFTRQFFQWTITIILARLLRPDEFGIVGMAALVTGFVAIVNELGLAASIVQRKEVTDVHLSTAFWATLAAGSLVWAIVVAISPLAATFFRQPLVKPILVMSGLGLVIGPLGIVQQALLTKSLEFKKLAVVEMFSTAAGGLSSVVLALAGWGAWSLVLGGLLGASLEVTGRWLVCHWRPRFAFDFHAFRQLFRFGRNVMLANIVNYFGANIDYMLVGRVLGSSALGLYTKAYELATLPQTRFAPVITRVAFPSFSCIQDDNARLRQGYLQMVSYVSMITVPALMGLAVVSPEFIQVLYGPQWGQSTWPLRILCVAGAMYSLLTIGGPVVLAKGRSDIPLITSSIRVVAIGILVAAGLRFGIVGVAAGVSIYTLLIFWPVQWWTNSLIGLSMGEYLSALRPAVLAAAMACMPVLAWRQLNFQLWQMPDIALLLTDGLWGGLAYVVALRLLAQTLLEEALARARPSFRPTLDSLRRHMI